MNYKFEIYKDANSEYRWRFKAPNGQIVAVSGKGYTTKDNCKHSIGLVKRFAPDAPVEDLTLAASLSSYYR